jgi:hypothetical protein
VGAVPGRIEVDVAGLRALGSALRGLQEEIIDARDVLGSHRADLGSERLSAALDHFAGNWSHRREAICDEMQTVAGFVHGAADCYRDVEGALAAAWTTGGRR